MSIYKDFWSLSMGSLLFCFSRSVIKVSAISFEILAWVSLLLELRRCLRVMTVGSSSRKLSESMPMNYDWKQAQDPWEKCCLTGSFILLDWKESFLLGLLGVYSVSRFVYGVGRRRERQKVKRMNQNCELGSRGEKCSCSLTSVERPESFIME